MSGFKTTLVITKFSPDQWQLTMPLVYEYTEDIVFTVPAGFVTDFASVPRIFYVSVPRTGGYDLATCLHDYLYRTQPCSRAQVDAIFKQAMKDCGVGWYTRTKIWMAVRLGGGAIWKNHQDDRNEAA